MAEKSEASSELHDRVNLMLATVQVMAPALSDNQIKEVAKSIFELLGVTLPEVDEGPHLRLVDNDPSPLLEA